MASVKIYTRKGDDGTTGLYYGGRVRKDDPAPAAYGDVDEAQSAIGVARAACRERDGVDCELDRVLIALEKDLWVLMADLATEVENRGKLVEGMSLVSDLMVEALEHQIDDYSARFSLPAEFVVPGQTMVSALLDVARTVVRRAERTSLSTAADGIPRHQLSQPAKRSSLDTGPLAGARPVVDEPRRVTLTAAREHARHVPQRVDCPDATVSGQNLVT